MYAMRILPPSSDEKLSTLGDAFELAIATESVAATPVLGSYGLDCWG